MYSGSLFVLALAIFGASAQCVSNGLVGTGLTGLNGLNGLTGLNGLNGLNTLNTFGAGIGSTVGTAPVIENVPIRLPGFVTPTSVQDSCNCVKTIVRPQLRKEVFTIPSVQRFVQTTSTPVVETVPYVRSAGVEVPAVDTVGYGTGLGFGGVSSLGGYVSGVNTGLVNGVVGTGLTNVIGTGINGVVGTGINGVVGTGINGVVGTGINGVVGTGINGVVGTGLGLGC